MVMLILAQVPLIIASVTKTSIPVRISHGISESLPCDPSAMIPADDLFQSYLFNPFISIGNFNDNVNYHNANLNDNSFHASRLNRSFRSMDAKFQILSLFM